MGWQDAPEVAPAAAAPKWASAPEVRLTDPGIGETAFDHAIHGATAGFSDELNGAGRAMGGKLADMLGLERHPESFTQLYRQGRDTKRADLAAEAAANPVTAKVADVAGATGGLLLPGLGAAAGTAKGAAQLGAASAALRSMGDSAEGINPAKTIYDTATGALMGRGGYMAGKLLGPLAGKLKDKAIEQGRRVLMGGAQSLSRKLPISPEAVQEALDVGAFKPLGTTQGAADRLGVARDAVGDQYSKIVSALEAKGITGPDAQTLAQSISAEGQSVAKGTLNEAVPRVYEKVADQLPGKAAGDIPLSQAESLKRSLQRMAAYDKTAPADVNDARKEVASMVRKAVEDSIDSQTRTPGNYPLWAQTAAQFEPVKQQYGRLAEAARAAEAGVNQAARRSGPSLTDTLAGATMAATHGVPMGILAKQGHAIWRQRGPSTMAAGADWLANALGRVSPAGTARAGIVANDELQSLIDALRGNQ